VSLIFLLSSFADLNFKSSFVSTFFLNFFVFKSSFVDLGDLELSGLVLFSLSPAFSFKLRLLVDFDFKPSFFELSLRFFLDGFLLNSSLVGDFVSPSLSIFFLDGFLFKSSL
jgi:hypothetical protein